MAVRRAGRTQDHSGGKGAAAGTQVGGVPVAHAQPPTSAGVRSRACRYINLMLGTGRRACATGYRPSARDPRRRRPCPPHRMPLAPRLRACTGFFADSENEGICQDARRSCAGRKLCRRHPRQIGKICKACTCAASAVQALRFCWRTGAILAVLLATQILHNPQSVHRKFFVATACSGCSGFVASSLLML